jgi:quinol monooxygenase YgiN
MTRIVVTATLKAKPGKGDELAELLGGLVDAVGPEEGTEQFVIHRVQDDPDTVFFYEVYRDQAALDAHRQNPALGAGGAALGELLDGRPVLTMLTPVKAKGMAL